MKSPLLRRPELKLSDTVRGTKHTAEKLTIEELIQRWRRSWSDWLKELGKWNPIRFPTPSPHKIGAALAQSSADPPMHVDERICTNASLG
jgi:hypothetical protein